MNVGTAWGDCGLQKVEPDSHIMTEWQVLRLYSLARTSCHKLSFLSMDAM